ncbi:MAG: hypothetical protein U1E20_10490 [Methylocystis sp.]|uniref:hypothetical protein n=1 Tax=Methylocystis sp. TaxID=1911079 RepID=UPI0039447BDB
MALPNPNSLADEQDKLAETRQWSHHVADFDACKVLSFELDRPVTRLSRIERLSRVVTIDETIFGAPLYRLTARKPYQPSPEAWLYASSAAGYYAAYDYIIWAIARDTPASDRGFMTFHFGQSPGAQCLVSLSLTAKAYGGSQGSLRVLTETPFREAQIPIGDVDRAHFVDLIVTITEGQALDVWMIPDANVQLMTFRAATFGRAPPVLNEAAI